MIKKHENESKEVKELSSENDDKKFLIVSPQDIKSGVVTDKYFIWTEKILRSKGLNPRVVAEITAREWGIFSGLNDVLSLLEGKNIDVYAMPEGSIFYPNEPVMVIEGNYLEFARLETSLLGFICHSSGVSRAAFKAKFAAKDKKVLSFGTRRQHPALAAMIERAAYIGGVDGVSNYSAEKYLGLKSVGTMPHALIICFGDQVEAWRAFDEVVERGVPRIMLVDTYCDEKSEAIMAVERVERVDGVRLDTPSSRRGDIRAIIEEIRWELFLRGKDVNIVLSGGISFEEIAKLRDIVDAFGVGTSIACAKPVDFALDLVEKEGKAVAKRGKFGGRKVILRDGVIDVVVPYERAKDESESVLVKVIEGGEITKDGEIASSMEGGRSRALRTMELVRDFFVGDGRCAFKETLKGALIRTPDDTDLKSLL